MYSVKVTRSSKGVNVNKELIAMSKFDEQRMEMRFLLFARHLTSILIICFVCLYRFISFIRCYMNEHMLRNTVKKCI